MCQSLKILFSERTLVKGYAKGKNMTDWQNDPRRLISFLTDRNNQKVTFLFLKRVQPWDNKKGRRGFPTPTFFTHQQNIGLQSADRLL
jgi:hypothetical protein